jgi:spore coat protein U-like protein
MARAALLSVAAVAAMGAAQAATDTTTFKVKLTVTESCLIGATLPTDVSFANQARTAAALTLDAAGQLNVNCTVGTAYNIGLNGGLNATIPAGTAAPVAGNRRMRLGATTNYVPYELYSNAARTTFWGNTIGTSTLTGTGTGASVAVPVYGRVTSANVPAGAYEDTVTATVTY